MRDFKEGKNFMIKDKLTRILETNKNLENKYYLRSLLKEVIQDYILNFTYNNQAYKKLIFTGGTCLRKIYGLPRLSEDLDFDFIDKFSLANYAKDLKTYFVSNLLYKELTIKTSGKQKTIFLKLPILKELGFAKTRADSNLLLVRCDFSKEKIGIFNTEINPISTDEFSFFSLSYDLSTLFANKIIAFLERQFFKGKEQKIPFKGRDIFDLVWFFEKAEKTDFSLQPNWKRVFKELKLKNKEEILARLLRKLEEVNKKGLYYDLLPFIESTASIKSFTENYFLAIRSKLKYF